MYVGLILPMYVARTDILNFHFGSEKTRFLSSIVVRFVVVLCTYICVGLIEGTIQGIVAKFIFVTTIWNNLTV